MASVNIEKWGSNEKIVKIVLENEYLKAEISTLGAALVALNLKNGRPEGYCLWIKKS